MQSLLIGLTILLSYCDGFIVPQEVSSLLSAFYSNIPPITKGIDSRFGVGFRLGKHADFQTIIELGPQKFTKSLGKSANDDSGGSDTSKRMVNHSECNKVTTPTYEWIHQYPIPTASTINTSALGQMQQLQSKINKKTNKFNQN